MVLIPGNHDHRLAEPLIENLALGGGGRSSSSTMLPPRAASARTDLGLARRARLLDLAYPGIWLRDDVYATHGHYMDCHMSLPRLECIAAAVLMRAFGSVPDPATPFDYERVLRPVYGLSARLAQSELAQRREPPLRARLANDLGPRAARAAGPPRRSAAARSGPRSRRRSGRHPPAATHFDPVLPGGRSPPAASTPPASSSDGSASRRSRDHRPHSPRRAR